MGNNNKTIKYCKSILSSAKLVSKKSIAIALFSVFILTSFAPENPKDNTIIPNTNKLNTNAVAMFACGGTVGGTAPTDDFDGDGVCNNVDLDDDNDGILDTDEGFKQFFTPNFQSTTSTVSGAAFKLPAATANGLINNIDCAGPDGYVFNTTSNTNPTFTYSITVLSGENLNTFQMYGTVGSAVNEQMKSFDLVITNTATSTVVVNSSASTGTTLPNGTPLTIPVNLGPGTYSIVLTDTDVPLFDREFSEVRFLGTNAPIDSDGDTIPDYLDTDSDNDGCPDAIEGGGTVTAAQLDANNRITGGVNTYGIPTLVATGCGAGQAVGSSTDDSINPCCTNPAGTGSLDTDNDGVGDLCDLDDDNDGILDADECGGITFTESYITGGAITVIGGGASGSPVVSNAGPSSNENGLRYIDQASGLTYYRVAFSGANRENLLNNFINFRLYIQSAGELWATATPDIRIIGNSTTVTADLSVAPFNETGPEQLGNFNVSHQISAANFGVTEAALTAILSDLDFIDIRAEFYTGLTGVIESELLPYTGSIPCTQDTDNDGLANGVDTDSDNDGCPDAIEAAGTVQASSLNANGRINGAVNANGVPILAAAGSGNGQANTASVVTAERITINSAPSNQNINTGGSATFNVSATSTRTTTFNAGTPNYTVPPGTTSTGSLIYKWYKNSAPNTTLSTTSSYTINNAQAANAGTYTVEVSNTNNSCPTLNTFTVTTGNPCTDGAIVGTPTANDPDADGINNECDLDDDNDGILDTDEGSINQTISITGQNASAVTGTGSANNPARSIDGVNGASGSNAGSASFQNPGDLTFNLFNGTVLDAGTVINVFGQKEGDVITNYFISEDGVNFTLISNLNITAYQNYSFTLPTPAAFFRIEVASVQIVPVSGIFRIDNVSFESTTSTTTSTIDTDGDGIPNHLDLDSDGDGCPDVLEAAVPTVLQTANIENGDGMTNTITSTANAQINTTLDPVGANGLANILETVLDNGTIANAFTTTNYTTYALDDTKNGCGTPMITQVYWKGTEKIIEVTNNAPDKIVVPNAANVNFFDGGTTTSRTATIANAAEITAGNSILYSSEAITAQVKSGVTSTINTGVTAFDNTNDIITISRSGVASSTLAYESRIDVVSGLTDNTAFVRIDETLVPNTTYTASEWVAFIDDNIPKFGDPVATGTQRHPHDPLLSEITSGVNTEANALLGLHRFGITTRTGNAWNNGYPDRSRFVVINEDYNHTTARLSARKLTVNASRKLGVTDNLLVVTNNVVLNGDIRLINSSGATGNSAAQFIQTHTLASLVSGGGRLLVDQNSTVPSLYRYNYMSSPVKETAGSTTYSIANVFKDGTNPTNFDGIVNTNIAKDITFDSNTYDGDTTDPITLADYWMYTYETENTTPADWEQVRSTGNINNTDGFIFKGPGRVQNYTFLGVPKDGTLTTPINGFESYLVGNPYPSALSVVEFLQDNLSATTGVLYFWEHVGEESTAEAISGHLYSGYKGGYATRTLLTGVDAKAAGGGPSNVLLESSLSTNVITGTIETIVDGQTNAEVVMLDSATDKIEFRDMSRSVDTLIVRYSSTEAKTLEFIQASRGTLKSYELPSTGGQLQNDTIPLCLISGKTLTLKSLDTKEINIDYIRLYDNDGDVACAPSTDLTEFTFTEPKAYIPIGQGFFVSGDTDGGTITFNNSQREYVIEGAESVFFKTSNRKESSTGIPIIKIGMNYSSGTSTTSILHRQLAISFDNAQSFNYEKGYDAQMYDIGTTDFYWKFPNDEDKYVIAGVQSISNDLEVPLEVVMGYSGEVSITLDEIKNINQDIYITDKVDGISYKITNTKATLSLEQGVYNNRFVLAFKQTNTLSTDDDLTNAFSNIYVDNKNSFINIVKRGEINIENVALFDLLGKQIFSWKIKEQKENYQLKINRKLPTGVYIVKLNSNRGESNKKVIIE